jgi:hypothetical protein
MRMDFSSPTGEQQQNLIELLKACQWLVDAKKLNMADSAIVDGIERIAAVSQKKVAA